MSTPDRSSSKKSQANKSASKSSSPRIGSAALCPLSELCGFAAAHAVWSVSEGDTLIPIGCSSTTDGETTLERFVTERLEEGVDVGLKWLGSKRPKIARAVLVCDGWASIGGNKMSALAVESRDHSLGGKEMIWLIPYSPADSPDGFRVYLPQLVTPGDVSDEETQTLAEALWKGMESHQKGFEVIDAHFDNSL